MNVKVRHNIKYESKTIYVVTFLMETFILQGSTEAVLAFELLVLLNFLWCSAFWLKVEFILGYILIL